MNIWEIQDELGLKTVPVSDEEGDHYYEGVLTSGEFCDVIGDYNVGLLNVRIINPNRLDYPFIVISTIDDGAWCAYGKNQIDLDEFVKNFNKTFGGYKLPSEKQFNEFIKDYGLYGFYTG